MPAKRLWNTVYTKLFLRDSAYMIPLGIGFLLLLAQGFLIWYFRGIIYRPDLEFFALHYKVQYGIDLLLPRYYIYALPGFGFIVLLVNAIVARYGHLHERFGMHLALIGACAVQVVLIWALYLVIQVNIF